MRLTQAQRFLECLGDDARLREELRLAVGRGDEDAFERVRAVLARAGLSLDSEDLSTVADHLRGRAPRRRMALPPALKSESRLAGLAGAFYLPSLRGWAPGQRSSEGAQSNGQTSRP